MRLVLLVAVCVILLVEDSSSTRHTAAAASDRSGPRRSRRLSANPSAATAATAADPAALAAISAAVGDAPHLPQNDIDAIAKTLAAERLSKPRECATGGAIDPDQLTHLCPLSPLKQRTDSPWQRQCQALLLENVCIVQETFVVYDPRQPDGGPAVPADLFETHDIKYWFRQRSGEDVAEEVDRGADMSSLSAPHHAFAHGGNESSVIGHEVTLGPLEARFAMQRELDSAAAALAGGSEMFDPCAEAVVLFSEWTMNYAESFTKVPSIVETLSSKLALRNKDVHFAIATPMKLPLQSFNEWYIGAYSAHKTLSLAELSALSPSQPRGACFRRAALVLVGTAFGGRSWIAAAEKARAAPPPASTSRWFCILLRARTHYLPQAPPSPWKSQGPGTTRVLIEMRAHAAARQFLNTEEVMRDCAKAEGIECRLHTFGEGPSGFLTDLSVLQHTDVLVSHHGAGQMNCVFMPQHASLLEIHPKGFREHVWWYSMWWPALSSQLEWRILYWGLNLEDPQLTVLSQQEAMGLNRDMAVNARDRFVILKWEYLGEMLTTVVIPNNYKWEAYRDRYEGIRDPARKEDWGIAGHINYFYNGSGVKEDFPVWCAWKCKQKWGPGLGRGVPPAPPAPPAPPLGPPAAPPA